MPGLLPGLLQRLDDALESLGTLLFGPLPPGEQRASLGVKLFAFGFLAAVFLFACVARQAPSPVDFP